MKHEPENLTLAHDEPPASGTAEGVSSGHLDSSPFYADEYVTLYNADVRQVLPQILGSFEVLITDPP